MTKQQTSVLLAAGGTGGHLFPAQALAEELKRRGITVDLATDMRGDRYGMGFPARSIHRLPSATLGSKSPVAMARTGDPHSATAQFFINVKDNDFLNYPGQDGWGYTVFGKVVEGKEVVDAPDTPETPAIEAGGNFEKVTGCGPVATRRSMDGL